jgi:hypothetical protein
MRAECAVLCIVLVIMTSTLTSCYGGTYITSYVTTVILFVHGLKASYGSCMHAVPTTISFRLPGCTFALCISECSVIAIRNAQVLQCSYCQKKDQCYCVFRHQLAAAEDHNETFV